VIQTRPARFTKLDKMKASFIAKFPEADIEFIALAGVDPEDTISKTLAQIAAGKQIDLQRVATEGIQLYAGAFTTRPSIVRLHPVTATPESPPSPTPSRRLPRLRTDTRSQFYPGRSGSPGPPRHFRADRP
jgi:hypothetical protein